MKELTVKKKIISGKELLRRTAYETDFSTFINEPVTIRDADTGKIILVYDYLDHEETRPIAALKRIKFQTADRSSGLMSTSRTIGYQPRVAHRRDFCSAAGLASESPVEHGALCSLARPLSKMYAKYFPDVFAEHASLTQNKVREEFRILDTPFTSGIVNKDNQLKYHFDSGNYKDVKSAMIVYKKNIVGGHLAIPEYDIGLELRNKSVLIFDGQGILHGVTPIVHTAPDAYRYSIVFYSLQAMWKCLTPHEELERIRRVKTLREFKRIKNKFETAEQWRASQ